MRDYACDVLAQLAGLPATWRRRIARIEHGSKQYEMQAVIAESGARVPWVLLSGGIHGEEPAGVHALIDFVKTSLSQHLGSYNFVVLPCINPSGFEAGTSDPASGPNINRSFGLANGAAEAREVERFLRELDRRFLFTMDLHEIDPNWAKEGFRPQDNPHACYLYEFARSPSMRIGRQMVDTLPDGIEACAWPRVYCDVNDRGVIAYPQSNGNPVYAKGTTFDAYLFANHTGHAFTTETPVGWELEKRKTVHLHFIAAALHLVE
jgi:murein peptide amidase A